MRKIVELDAREAAARLRFRCGAPNAVLAARGVRPQVETAVAALEHDLGGYGIKRGLTRKPIEGIARRLVSSP